VVADHSYRASAIYQMGLWSPDELLVKPMSLNVLSATVTLLSTTPRAHRPSRATRVVRREPAGSPVVLETPARSYDIAAENR